MSATDPFDGLRDQGGPQAPDPRFTADLRTRLERALLVPGGADMTTVHTAPTTPVPTTVEDPAAVPLPTLLPYLSVHDAAAALDFYVDAFGARRRGEPYVMPDGSIGHAELLLGDSAVLMLADESVPSGHLSPRTVGGSPVMLYLVVPDVDAAVARADALGATVERAAADYDHGRNAVLVDPYGHRWMIAAAQAPAATEPARIREGDLAYGSLWLPDAARAARFYGAVLGWRFAPGGTDRFGHVLDASPHLGLAGGVAEPTFFCSMAVDDLAAGLERVRAAGGQTEEVTEASYGSTAMCADDQGLRFALWQRPPGTDEGPGESTVEYLTMRFPDGQRAVDFYGSVLGWRTTASSPGGWQTTAADGSALRPMVGIHGGDDRASVEPMYSVPDVRAALDRISTAGGLAGEVEQQPYGLSATCADDQGSGFYLLQT